jgi:hypothetical protein
VYTNDLGKVDDGKNKIIIRKNPIEPFFGWERDHASIGQSTGSGGRLRCARAPTHYRFRRGPITAMKVALIGGTSNLPTLCRIKMLTPLSKKIISVHQDAFIAQQYFLNIT